MHRSRLVFPRTSTNLRLLFVCFGLVCLAPPGAVRASLLDLGQSSNCSDSIKGCKKPVKFVSKSDGCYTFACEYGLPNQHNIHTQNEADIRTLLQMEKPAGN